MSKPAMTLQPTHGELKATIKQYLQWTGWFTYPNTAGLGAHRGLSDLTAIKNGLTIWVEVKVKNDKLSAYQIKFKQDIESHGGVFIEARSLEDVIKRLEATP